MLVIVDQGTTCLIQPGPLGSPGKISISAVSVCGPGSMTWVASQASERSTSTLGGVWQLCSLRGRLSSSVSLCVAPCACLPSVAVPFGILFPATATTKGGATVHVSRPSSRRPRVRQAALSRAARGRARHARLPARPLAGWLAGRAGWVLGAQPSSQYSPNEMLPEDDDGSGTTCVWPKATSQVGQDPMSEDEDDPIHACCALNVRACERASACEVASHSSSLRGMSR